MLFVGCRLQTLWYLKIKNECWLDCSLHLANHLFPKSIITPNVLFQNCAKNFLKWVFLSGRHAEYTEMTSKTLCENFSSTFRRRCRTKHWGILDIFPVELIYIVKTFMVQKLSKKFYRHLSSIFVICGHVYIIHEYDNILVFVAT